MVSIRHKCRIRFVLLISLFGLGLSLSAQEPRLILPIGHTNRVNTAFYSNDGKYIVTASDDNTAKIWSSSDGKLVADLKGHTKGINYASFSPDGKFIVTASRDGTAKVWHTQDGILAMELKGHRGWVNTAFFDSSGKYIITASRDSTAKVWRVDNGRVISNLIGHFGTVNKAVFSRDGNYIATASLDGTARTWKRSNGELVAVLKGHSETIYDINFSPDGKYIVTGSYDNTAKVWKADSGLMLLDLKGHSNWVNSANYSSSGSYITTASYDNTVKIWRSDNGVLIADLANTNGVNYAEFSNDEKYILASTVRGEVKLWDLRSQLVVTELKGHNNDVYAARFSPDDKYIVTASADGTTKTWQSSSGEMFFDLKGHTSAVNNVVFSNDGKLFLSTSLDGAAKIWQSDNGQIIGDLRGHNDKINDASFSPDGKFIVTASSDSTAKLWQTSNGRLLADFKGHSNGIYSAVFSPDGKYIATGSMDGTAKIWATSNGRLVVDFKGHSGEVNSAFFSPDGRYVVTASYDNTAKVWQADNGKMISSLIGHKHEVFSAVFSPNGRYVLTASLDGTAKIWQVSNGKMITDLKGHTKEVYTAFFSPDGRYVSTASLDGTIKVWTSTKGQVIANLKGGANEINNSIFSPDSRHILTFSNGSDPPKLWRIEDSQIVADLRGHSDEVTSAAFSPDGNYIITASLDNTLRKWDTRTGELVYSFFLINQTDYLAIDKDGHFDGTENARKLLYYACGLEAVSLEQFKNLCWEPELVSKLMGKNKEPITARKLSEINICNYTPEVKEKGYINGNYEFQITPRTGGIGMVLLYVNDKLIKKYLPSTLYPVNGEYRLSVDQREIYEYFVSGENNQVTVKATTHEGNMTSKEATISFSIEKKKNVNPDMYIVSIGISMYKGEKLKLGYASKDAVDFASTMSISAQKLLNTDHKEHVKTFVFNTENQSQRWPLKPAIANVFDSIAKMARADDILIIFFAGHGVLQSGQKNFYLVTAEASSFEQIEELPGVVAISTDELNEWMRKIKASKQLLILDACKSGQVIQNLQEIIVKREIPADQQRALENLRDITGTFILSSSSSLQSAYESSLYRQGLLTYSLLSGIKLGNGLKENKYIDVTKWFNAASDNVKSMAKDIGEIQDPKIFGNNSSFAIGLVDQEVISTIKLSIKKKVFRRSTFIQNQELLNDDLDLSGLVDKELINLSAKGKDSPLAFAPDNTLSEAYSIRGKYEVKNNGVVVKVSIFKGKREIVYQFEAKSTVSKKEELASQIVKYVEIFLNK